MDINTLAPLFQGIGVPGVILLIIGYTARRAWLFCQPWLEKIAQAHIDRQNKMAEANEQLTQHLITSTTKCLNIHEENHNILKRLEEKFPTLCQGKA